MAANGERLIKRETGIPGLDAVTRGGLPAAGATLVIGAPGAGKTVLALQIIARALERGETALYITFEESRDQIARDGASFQWGAALGASTDWRVIDARPPSGAESAGDFDLEGLLAGLGDQVERLGAGWIVLDGIDRLLRLAGDTEWAVKQVADLNDWCRNRGVALLLTGKSTEADAVQPAYLEGLEFMLDTVLILSTELVNRRLNRRFRIAKYRGTAHITDELALVIDDAGLHLPYDVIPSDTSAAATDERVSMGIDRLDKLLGGGVYRGSTVLISGQPGTAKTTLSLCFAQAMAARGEIVLYVSFDEHGDRIVRNAASIGIDLRSHLDSGHLHVRTREAWRALVEEHYVGIHELLHSLRPKALVIDPVSALIKSTSAETASVTTERLIGQSVAMGITTVLTSLTEGDDPIAETTLSHVSTLADTWVSLGYNVRGGERNRSLSIVKSRGSAHSNQVRELLLSNEGVDLADVYQYGSEVLMGTARLHKEREEAAERSRAEREYEARRRQLERELEQARSRGEQAHSETERIREELTRLDEDERRSKEANAAHRDAIARRRDPSRSAKHDEGGEP